MYYLILIINIIVFINYTKRNFTSLIVALNFTYLKIIQFDLNILQIQFSNQYYQDFKFN